MSPNSVPAHDRLIHCRRHLRMPARHHDLQRAAGSADLIADSAHVGLRRPFWQQNGWQIKARPRAAHRQIIGAHIHRVIADLIGGEGDRIALGGQQSIGTIQFNDGGVLSHTRPQEKTRIFNRQRGDKLRQQVCRQFPGR